MSEIDFGAIEAKWQKAWAEGKVFEVEAEKAEGSGQKAEKPKFYVLEMFPYPSGAGLHMGHALNYTIGDILARFKIMKGFNVLHPMGFDALGLPAENAAIKAGTHPSEYTNKAIENFIRQQKMLGVTYDWSRMVNTASPDYYKWDQWIFLKMLERELAYQKEASVNWCPKCDTVLANEQVNEGKCWRHEDTDVEVRKLKQWFFRTTEYADELLSGLDGIDWPERTKAMQRNWIGKSQGAEIEFEVLGAKNNDGTRTNADHTDKIGNVVIVHGCPVRDKTKDKDYIPDNQKAWIGWTKEELDKINISCICPQMPTPWNPKYKEWKKEFEKIKVDENSVLIGTSGGGGFLVRWLGETQTKIKKLILVSPGMVGMSDRLNEFYGEKFYKNVKDLVREKIVIYTSEDDHDYHIVGAKKYAKVFDGKFVNFGKGYGHFTSKTLVEKDFPELLDEILATDGHGRARTNNVWKVFTTRPDTIFGVTFMVVAAGHDRLDELVTDEQRAAVDEYLKRMHSVSEKDIETREKEGVFSGSYAINPATGEKIPIWVGNFVLADYGSGMVMGVPAHDKRDFAFAQKYKIPVKEVVRSHERAEGRRQKAGKDLAEAFVGEGKLINSGEFDGLDNALGKEKIVEWLGEKAKKVVNFKLRDWGVSRQRYWGTPIPVVYCDECKKNVEEKSNTLIFYDQDNFNSIKNGKKNVETRALCVDDKDKEFYGNVKIGDSLKVLNKITGEVVYINVEDVKRIANLKKLFDDKVLLGKIFPDKIVDNLEELKKLYSFSGNYLDRIEKNGLVAWTFRLIVPGVVAVPEKDLPVELPKDVKFGEGNPLESAKDWIKTSCPKCGGEARRETDTMDTFVNSSWYFLRYADPNNSEKIFDKDKAQYWNPVDVYIGGAEHACMHLLYARFYTKFLRDIGVLDFDEPFMKLFHQGMLHAEDGRKMSKSLGNVVEPIETMKKFGVDATRWFLISVASPDKNFDWSEKGISGATRFLKKVYDFYDKSVGSGKWEVGSDSDELLSKLNLTLKNLEEYYGGFDYRKATIEIRELFALIEKGCSVDTARKFVKMIAPITPHLAEELWSKINASQEGRRQKAEGRGEFVSTASWPEVDLEAIGRQKAEGSGDLNGKIVERVNEILSSGQKVESRGQEVKKVYVYVMPFEIGKIDVDKIREGVGKDVEVFAVNDSGKVDPEGRAKRAKPGMCSVWLE